MISFQRAFLFEFAWLYLKMFTRTDISQHSEEWHNARRGTIGGSSIGVLLGVGFVTIQQFLEEKLLPKPPLTQEAIENAEIAMNWGTVFEDVLANYTEQTYNCKLTETNAFYIGKDKYTGLSFSPDGIAEMDVEIGNYEEEVKCPEGYKIVYTPITERRRCLVEFKCPYSRGLRNYMPDYYRPQVLMGLDFLELPHGIFIEGLIRPCYAEQYDDTTNHAKEYDSRKYKEVLARGIVGVAGEGMIDLGHAPALLASALVEMKASCVHMTTPPTSGYKYLLYWKLFQVGKFQVDREPQYLDGILPAVRKVLQFMDDMRGKPEELIREAIKLY
jgi:hypothetical protein